MGNQDEIYPDQMIEDIEKLDEKGYHHMWSGETLQGNYVLKIREKGERSFHFAVVHYSLEEDTLERDRVAVLPFKADFNNAEKASEEIVEILEDE